MRHQAKKLRVPQTAGVTTGVTVSGSLKKTGAASLILGGETHIHCAPLRERDACVRITRKRLSGTHAEYPWHPTTPQLNIRIKDSRERVAIISSVLDSLFSAERTLTKETIKLVLEELTTNAIYHSIRDKNGKDAYRRTRTVCLTDAQAVELTCHRSDEGAFLSVTDKGGALRLEDIGTRLLRCYKSNDQLEKKESGAGLGFFMVFENATHIEIIVAQKLSTTIRVWLPLIGSASPDYFSFNYWGGNHVTK